MSVDAGLTRLRAVLTEMGSVLVAYSGGVDSALLARVASDVLGERAVAVTATSPTLPAEEAEGAHQVATENGIRHLVVDTHELEREGYQANAGDRCYHCKSELFEVAQRMRVELGLAWVADGTILDDLGDHRPGLVAADENRVRHPLLEAGFNKALVRDAARALGLSVWDKPALACLGSRFPAGTRVSLQKIERVAAVERRLRLEGVRQFRVRWHEIGEDVLARIEVEPSELGRVLLGEARERVVAAAKEAGFRWVTLDLLGYRSPTAGLS